MPSSFSSTTSHPEKSVPVPARLQKPKQPGQPGWCGYRICASSPSRSANDEAQSHKAEAVLSTRETKSRREETGN